MRLGQTLSRLVKGLFFLILGAQIIFAAEGQKPLPLPTPTFKPDLYMTSEPAIVTPEAFALAAGSPVTISAQTAKNQGVVSAGSFSLGYYLSRDSTITTTDTFLGSAFRLANLSSGGSATFPQATFTIPAGTAAGAYYIGVMADCTKSVLETNETNNTAKRLVKIGPNLTYGIGFPALNTATAAQGGSITVKAPKVINDGGQTAGASTLGIYLSSSNVHGANDYKLADKAIPGIAAGSIYYVGDVNVTIPTSYQPGKYFIHVVVDTGNVVKESNETAENNTYTTGIDIGPNLTITSADISPSVYTPDNSIYLNNITIKNTGAQKSATCSYALYYSADAVITRDDKMLTQVVVPALDPGSQFSDGGIVLTIPTTATVGAHNLGLFVDYINQVKESNESDNIWLKPITVVSKPDLIISSGAPILNRTIIALGQTVTVTTWTVRNQGGAGGFPTGAFTCGYYLSSDATITYSDTKLGVDLPFSSLSPGGIASVPTTTLTIPTTVLPGTYYLGILADKNWNVNESSETNNFVSTKVTIATLQDLTIINAGSPLVTPGMVAPGGAVSLASWTVKNQGGQNSWSFTSGYYLSADAVISTSDKYLGGTSNLRGLVAGAQTVWPATASLTIPATTAPGLYYLGILVDRANAIAESNEKNNTVVSTQFVVGPDLTITSGNPVIVPASIAPGGKINVPAFTVKNLGSASAPFDYSVYLSTDATITASDTNLGGGGYSLTLQPGLSTIMSPQVLTVPTTMKSGNYYLGILVDPANTLKEARETNNTVATLLHIGDDTGNTAATATALAVGVSRVGVIESAGDVDFYGTGFVAGSTYDIVVTLGTLTDSKIYLYKSDGVTQLGYNDDNPRGGKGSRITYKAPTTGAYFIKVAGYSTSLLGSYTLKITKQ